jgi:probable HAF family extracellular repeat protein
MKLGTVLLLCVSSLIGPIPARANCICDFLTDLGEALGDVLCDVTNCAGTSKAFGINTAGQIVGGIDGTGMWRGYRFDLNGRSITPIQVPGSLSTRAFSINAPGQIVGEFLDAAGRTHGFLFSGGLFTPIQVPGSPSTRAFGINTAGQIVGNFRDATTFGGTQTHGFLLNGGTFSRIQVPGSAETDALGINDSGQIVGDYSTDASGIFHGFLLSEGTFNTIDVPGTPSTEAFGINTAGQIVGAFLDSKGEHAFLAMPVPEPAIWPVLCAGLIGFLIYRPRWRQLPGQLLFRLPDTLKPKCLAPCGRVSHRPTGAFIEEAEMDAGLEQMLRS